MIKRKTFYGDLYNDRTRKKFDDEIDFFVDELSQKGCAIIKYLTNIYGVSSNYSDKIRTEIVYREIKTREVIVEKKND